MRHANIIRLRNTRNRIRSIHLKLANPNRACAPANPVVDDAVKIAKFGDGDIRRYFCGSSKAINGSG